MIQNMAIWPSTTSQNNLLRSSEDYHQCLNQLKSKFMKCAYPAYVVDNHFNKLKDVQEKDLLQYKDKNLTSKTHFSVTYNKTLPHIKVTIYNL